jgi:hypothetical protein
MNALRRRLLKLATLLGALMIFWACNAPFIPVPPPGATFTMDSLTDSSGTTMSVWISHGLPSANASGATFFIVNQRTQNGVITVAGIDGTYTAPPLEGMQDDHVLLSFRTPNGDYSDSLCLLLTTSVDASTGSASRCP